MESYRKVADSIGVLEWSRVGLATRVTTEYEFLKLSGPNSSRNWDGSVKQVARANRKSVIPSSSHLFAGTRLAFHPFFYFSFSFPRLTRTIFLSIFSKRYLVAAITILM